MQSMCKHERNSERMTEKEFESNESKTHPNTHKHTLKHARTRKGPVQMYVKTLFHVNRCS